MIPVAMISADHFRPSPAGSFHLPPEPADAVPRRRFLSLVSCGIGCCALAGPIRAATDRPVDVGRPEDYPRDGISEKFIQHDLFVIRHRGRLYACTAVCPHKANLLLLDPKQTDRIICSGHESTFDLDGVNRGGPARRALERFGITLNHGGRIMVDTTKTFRQPQWDDPASFLKIG